MRSVHSRRVFLAGTAGLACRAANFRPAVAAVDHLLLGVSDLDRGVAWVEERTGVRAAAGGSHPGRGTRNALVSLGKRHYLEIIAPDPAQSSFNFQIDVRPLEQPKLITWAASTTDIEYVAKSARDAGLKVFGPIDGSRQTPAGGLLKWKTLGVTHSLRGGAVDPVPFFIEWDAGSRHPSEDSPGGANLRALRSSTRIRRRWTRYFARWGLRRRWGKARVRGCLRSCERGGVWWNWGKSPVSSIRSRIVDGRNGVRLRVLPS
jgi:hypothetical protein